jgi:hypothetical protein
VPYDPNANPYIINPKELPANQTAAAQVPAKNIGTANQWCQSPYYLPNWSLGGAQATSPVATASVTWPDTQIADRDIAANNALAAEKARQTSVQTLAGQNVTAINTLTGGAPGIGSVTPNTAVHNAGTAVTIQGSGFTGASSVTIGAACTSVVVVNDGEITCNLPVSGTVAGAANVVVVATGGTGTLTGGLTYT